MAIISGPFLKALKATSNFFTVFYPSEFEGLVVQQRPVNRQLVLLVLF